MPPIHVELGGFKRKTHAFDCCPCVGVSSVPFGRMSCMYMYVPSTVITISLSLQDEQLQLMLTSENGHEEVVEKLFDYEWDGEGVG